MWCHIETLDKKCKYDYIWTQKHSEIGDTQPIIEKQVKEEAESFDYSLTASDY